MSAVARWLEHVTLTTGHSRRSYRDEIAPESLAHCRSLIERFTAGEVSEPVPIGIPGYSISGRRAGKCLVATVYADGPPSELIATIGVAGHSRCGSRLWRELHRWGRVPVVTDPERPPPEPWVAAALDEGALRPQHRQVLPYVGALEACLAWAFLTGEH